MDLSTKFFSSITNPSRILSDLYFEKGYNLTVTEAAASINVTERYLLRVFGEKFDYVLVPKGATQCFNTEKDACFSKLKEKDLKANERIALEKDIERYKFLTRKRVFINRDSFLKFLTNNLNIDTDYVAIRLTQEENQCVSRAELDEIVDEVLKSFKFKNDYGRLVTLSEAKQILRNPLQSGRTLKDSYLKAFYANENLRKTVHDTQLHRFLEYFYSNQRYTIQGNGDERDVVRYQVVFDVKDEEIFTSFLVPNCPPKIQENIKREVIKAIKEFRENLKQQKASEK